MKTILEKDKQVNDVLVSLRKEGVYKIPRSFLYSLFPTLFRVW